MGQQRQECPSRQHEPATSSVVAAIRRVQHGRCRSIFLILELGGEGPDCQVVCRLVETWAMLITPGTLRRMTGAWQKAVSRITQAPENRRWGQVKGPTTAVIATLLDYHWEVDPADPFRWRSPCGGDTWELRLDPAEPVPDIQPFAEEVEASVRAATWQRARGTTLERAWNTVAIP